MWVCAEFIKDQKLGGKVKLEVYRREMCTVCFSKYDSFLGFWCNMFVCQKVAQGFSVFAESMHEVKFQQFSTVLPQHL